MSKIEKVSPFRNLAQYQVLVNDTVTNSQYFRLTQIPDTLTSGKNAFLINGSVQLEPTTTVLVEIIDSTGNTIFYEPIKNYQEGLARLVSIEIYEDTPPGPATMTILGEIVQLADGSPIPSIWANKYNVKYTHTFTVDPTKINSTPIRLYNIPQVTVSEFLSSYRDSSPHTITGSTGGSVTGSPLIIPLDIGKPVSSSYSLQFSSLTLSSSLIGGGITASANGITFSSSIVDVLNSSTAFIQPGYISSSLYQSFATTNFTTSFAIPTSYVPTLFTRSFANIIVNNLTTFAGDISKAKVYVRSVDSHGEYEPINDVSLIGANAITTQSAVNQSQISMGHFINQNTIASYWSTGSLVSSSYNFVYTPSNSASLLFNSGTLLDSVHLSGDNSILSTGSITPKYYFNLNAPITFFANSEYTLQNSLVCVKNNPNFNGRIEVYLSGSAFPSSNPLGQLITTYQSNYPTTRTTILDDQKNFFSLYNGTATLYYVVYGGDWYVSYIDILSAEETGFNPDVAQFLIPINNKRLENLQFKVELYDINNNIVPADIESIPIFFSGSTFYTKGTDNRLQGTITLTPSGSGPAIGVNTSGSFIGIGGSTSLPQPIDISQLSSYTGPPIVTIYSGSTPFSSSASGSAAGLQIAAGQSTSASFLDFNTLTGRLTIRGDITLLPGSALSQSISNLTSGSTGSGDGTLALQQLQALVSGTLLGGTYLNGTEIISPNIAGVTGYFSSLFGVGNIIQGNGIVLSSLGYTASNGAAQSGSPAIYIGQGTFDNQNTPFMVASSSAGGILSLGTNLVATSSAGVFSLLISGNVAIVTGSDTYFLTPIEDDNVSQVPWGPKLLVSNLSGSEYSGYTSSVFISGSLPVPVGTLAVNAQVGLQTASVPPLGAYIAFNAYAQSTTSQSLLTWLLVDAAVGGDIITSATTPIITGSWNHYQIQIPTNKLQFLTGSNGGLGQNKNYFIFNMFSNTATCSISMSSLAIRETLPVFTDVRVFVNNATASVSGNAAAQATSYSQSLTAQAVAFSQSQTIYTTGVSSSLISVSASQQQISSSVITIASSSIPSISASQAAYTTTVSASLIAVSASLAQTTASLASYSASAAQSQVTLSSSLAQQSATYSSSLASQNISFSQSQALANVVDAAHRIQLPTNVNKTVAGLYLEAAAEGFWQPHPSGNGISASNFPVLINSGGQFVFADSASWTGSSTTGYWSNYVESANGSFIIQTPNLYLNTPGLQIAGFAPSASNLSFIKVGANAFSMSLAHGAGFYTDGNGNFRVGSDTSGSDFIELTPGNALIVSSSNFILQSTNAGNTLHLDPLQISLGNPNPLTYVPTGSGAQGFYVNRNGQLFLGSGSVDPTLAGIGTGSWVSFDGSSLNARLQRIFLNANGLFLQGADNLTGSGNVIKLGTAGQNITLVKNQGLYVDGGGNFRIGTDTSSSISASFIEFIPGAPSSLIISSSTFFLNATDVNNNTVKLSNFVLALGNPVPTTYTPIGAGSVGFYTDNQGHLFVGSGSVGAIAGQGTGSWISFDGSTLNARLSRFFLNSNGLVLQGADSLTGTSNVLKIGAAGSGITLTKNAGLYVDGGGNFRVGTDTSGSDYIELTPGNALIISSSNFLLNSSNTLQITPIQIALGSPIPTAYTGSSGLGAVGFYANNAGQFFVGSGSVNTDITKVGTGSYISFGGSGISIAAQAFLLSTPTLYLNSLAQGSNPTIYVSSSNGPAINISADGGTASFAGTVYAGGLVVNGTATFTGSSILNAPLQTATIKTVQTNKITNTLTVSQSNATPVNNITLLNGTETLYGWSSNILNVTASSLAMSSSVIIGDYQIASGSLITTQTSGWTNISVLISLTGNSSWVAGTSTPTITVSPANGQQAYNNTYYVNGGLKLASTLGTNSTGFTSADGRVDLQVSYDSGTTWIYVDTVDQDSIGELGNITSNSTFNYPFRPSSSLHNGDSFKLQLVYYARLGIFKAFQGDFEVGDNGGATEQPTTWQYSVGTTFNRRGLQILAQVSGSTTTTGSINSFNIQPMSSAPTTTMMVAGDVWAEQTGSLNNTATLYWFNGVNKIKLG